MPERNLVMLIGGKLTRSRAAHLYKLMILVHDEFTKILVIHEGTNPIPINRENVEVKVTGINSAYPKDHLVIKVIQYLKQEIRRIKIISNETNQESILLYRGIYQPLSLIFNRIMGRYVILFGGGFDYFPTRYIKSWKTRIFSSLRWTIQLALLKLFNKIIFETPSVQRFYGLGKFHNKSVDNGHLFVDTDKFRKFKDLDEREYDVGFIGSLSSEKGILVFIYSIVHLLEKRNLKVLIVGQGTFQNYVAKLIEEKNLQQQIEIRNTLSYSRMPEIYNQLKLLVVPSMSEGLPNVIIEAMACETPVLATPVGGIPDVLKHMSTGGLLDSINPFEISAKISDLLEDNERLEQIGRNARKLITEEFSLAVSKKNWRKILSSSQ